jgi:hypothetical protein
VPEHVSSVSAGHSRAEPTGDDAVDAALAPLGELGEVPVREHVAVFDAVHTALQDRLADTGE